jgi:carbon monoxide dehydrogenase subunit G
MKVELEKSFVIKAAVADCWRLLSDIPRVATCMPGASITRVIDASHFVGLVMVSIGPMRLQFAGELELVMIDASARKLVLMATGTDKSGSSATMKLITVLVAKENHETLLNGHAEVTVNGQLAQFGSRMISPVSDVILSQFADHFRQKLLQPSTAAEVSEALEESEPSEASEKPVLNASSLLWATAKKLLSSLWGKSDSPSSDGSHRKSSIWSWLYRK